MSIVLVFRVLDPKGLIQSLESLGHNGLSLLLICSLLIDEAVKREQHHEDLLEGIIGDDIE